MNFLSQKKDTLEFHVAIENCNLIGQDRDQMSNMNCLAYMTCRFKFDSEILIWYQTKESNDREIQMNCNLISNSKNEKLILYFKFDFRRVISSHILKLNRSQILILTWKF